MATKRKPGAVIGRPKKTRAPKRGKGRPAKPLVSDPNRYTPAFAQALMDHHHRMATGISENKVAETMVGISYGAIIQKEENLDAMMRGDLCSRLSWKKVTLKKSGGESNGAIDITFDQ